MNSILECLDNNSNSELLPTIQMKRNKRKAEQTRPIENRNFSGGCTPQSDIIGGGHNFTCPRHRAIK